MIAALTFPSVRSIAFGLIGLALSCSFFFTAVPRAHAAALTAEQISSVVGLLQAFGVDQEIINKIQTTLTSAQYTKTSVVYPTIGISSTTSTTTTTYTPPIPTQSTTPTQVQPQTQPVVQPQIQAASPTSTSTTTIAAPVISARLVSSSSVLVAYSNIPQSINAEIKIVNQSTGVVVYTYSIPNGKDSAVALTIPVASIVEGKYVAKIVGTNNFSITSNSFALSGAAPQCSITVQDGTISWAVSWNSSGATSATSNVYTGGSSNTLSIPLNGTNIVAPSTPTTYSFLFTGPGGTTRCVSPVLKPAIYTYENATPNTSIGASSAVNPVLAAYITPQISTNGQTVAMKWDVTAPAGYKLEIGMPTLLKNRGDLPGNSPLYKSNFLAPATLDGTTGVLSGVSSGNTMATVPSHGTLNFVTNYSNDFLPLVSSVTFTLLDASGAYVTQAVTSIQVNAPSVSAATGGITGTTLAQSPSATPTVYGVAAGTDKVTVALTNSASSTVFTSAVLPVVDGQWSVKVTGVAAGKYLIHVYDAAHNNAELEGKFFLTVSNVVTQAPLSQMLATVAYAVMSPYVVLSDMLGSIFYTVGFY